MMAEFIEIQQVNTAQVVMGEGQPIVMLHGWGANHQLLMPLAERLAPLGYCLYMPDLPGFGQSAPPPIAWDVHQYARFVIAYMDHHALEKTHLFGHSFGGRLALVLGAQYPERLLKIALADSAGVRDKTPPAVQIRTRAYKALRDGLQTIGLSNIADRLRAWYNQKYGSADYQNTSGVMRETFVKVVNEDLLSFAARVKPSTFLLWGEHDQDTPLWQGQLLEKTIPDAGLHVFHGAGHYSYLERPGETARIIDYFFKQV